MGTRTINVTVGNNLNAIVKGGENVNARVTFSSPDMSPFETPEIPGGRGYGPFQITLSGNTPKLTIGAGANHLGAAEPITVAVPAEAIALSVDLQGTYNGKIDIQTTFTDHA